jgi:hypothetical protein
VRTHTALALALGVLLCVSVCPAQAWRGHDRHRGRSVVIVPPLVVSILPDWRPYGAPPVVMTPAPPVYVQPSPPVYIQPIPPQPSWYACDDPPGYYPYVQQCPSGWRPVHPSPAP